MDAVMMKPSVLLLLVLLALSSAGPLDIRDDTEQRNASFESSSSKITTNRSKRADRPHLTAAKLRQKRQDQTSSIASDDGSNEYDSASNLEWVTWNNFLPNNSVSIYNDYTDRIDYVCKYKCEAGFYTPSKGPYCHYPSAKKAHAGFPFEILVNKNNSEILEWKDDSDGSVPRSAVRTCTETAIFVGKNKYGLGKVSIAEKAFCLQWKNDEYQYYNYQVLTINEDIISQQVYNVKYITDESEIIHYPPEIVQKTAIANYECHSVVKTDTLSKTYEKEHRWDFSFAIKLGFTLTFKASIPFIASEGIQYSTDVTFQYSVGKTVIESLTNAVSVQITAPANHSCVVSMVQYKYKVHIPFTALIRRTYANEEIRIISVTGTYNAVQVGEVRAMADRCEPLENSKPCP